MYRDKDPPCNLEGRDDCFSPNEAGMGRCRIELGEDKPFIELLPELLRNYGRAVEHGNRNIYQALPRMLTIWFEYGDYCCANISPANTKVRFFFSVHTKTSEVASSITLSCRPLTLK